MALPSNSLEAFLTLTQTGTFTKAAEKLHITQSALSQRILNLEEELRTTLLIRERGSLRLTSAGESLLHFCQAQKALEQEFLQDLHKADSKEFQGTFRIGGYSSVMKSFLMPALAPLLREHPIQIHFLTRQMSELPDLLKRSEADMIVVDQQLSSPGLESVHLGEEANVLTTSANHKKVQDWYLDHDEADDVTIRYFQKFGPKKKTLRRRFMSDADGLIEGVRQGWGQAVIPVHLLEKEKGIQLLDEDKILKIPVWLHYFQQPFYTKLHTKIEQEIKAHAKTKFL